MRGGSQNTLKAQLDTEIKAEILAVCGAAVQTPNCILGLAGGMANAFIPHLISNIEVVPGSFNVPGFGAVVGIAGIL